MEYEERARNPYHQREGEIQRSKGERVCVRERARERERETIIVCLKY